MKWTRRVVLGCTVTLVCGLAVVVQQRLKRPSPANLPGGVNSQTYVTISRATTYITEPLGKDGYVDYLAAINQRCQEGATPENNAAVPFLKARWPARIDVKHRDEYCRMLGIEPLPERGDYFVKIQEYAKRLSEADQEGCDALSGQLLPLETRPWSQKDFPALAGWLAANEKPLSLILQASHCPRRYDPLIADDGHLLAASLPVVSEYRNVVLILMVRAMHRLGEGKTDETWEDLLACHRLARLAGQGPTLIDALLAMTIEGRACAGDQALLQHVRLSAIQVAKMRNDLAKLPPMPRMADKIDLAERFIFLDCAAAIPQHGLGWIDNLGGGRPRSTIDSLVDSAANAAIDWDLILCMGNAWYDRIISACRKPTRTERMQAIREVDEDLRNLTEPAVGTAIFGFAFSGESGKALSQRIGVRLLKLLLPAVDTGANAEDKATMLFQLTNLAFALAAYRADHGSHPEKLAELSPKYVADVPEDMFSAAELRYEREGEGYVLYSIGPNGKDDGGRGKEDCKKDEEDWDDLVVRMPAAE